MAFLLLKGIPSLAGQNQAPQADPDDFVDRLNYRYTVILLNVFSAIVTNRQFSSKQIQCKEKNNTKVFFCFDLFVYLLRLGTSNVYIRLRRLH
jgi:hypothetical protein